MTTCDHNLQGTGLRSQDYIIVYTATICYDIDLIKESVDDEITTYLSNRFKNTPVPFELLGNRDLIEKFQKEEIAKFMETEEFKEFEKMIIEKYEAYYD